MELRQISENSYLLKTSNPLITSSMLLHYLGNSEAVIIDTGCCAAPELFEELDKRGWHIAAALCTHLHWDHIANNEEIFNRDGIIYAHENENRLEHIVHNKIEYPISFIKEGDIAIDGKTFTLVHTPGHTPGHCAVITPDEMCFLGDAVMGAEDLSMAKLPYMENVQEALVSMVKLKDLPCRGYAAGHNGYISPEDIDALIDANIKKEIDIYDSIRKLISCPIKVAEFPEKFMRSLNITNSVILAGEIMRDNAVRRLNELIRAGEIETDGVNVFPAGSSKEG